MSFTRTTAPDGRHVIRCDRCGAWGKSTFDDVVRGWARKHLCDRVIEAAHRARVAQRAAGAPGRS